MGELIRAQMRMELWNRELEELTEAGTGALELRKYIQGMDMGFKIVSTEFREQLLWNSFTYLRVGRYSAEIFDTSPRWYTHKKNYILLLAVARVKPD